MGKENNLERITDKEIHVMGNMVAFAQGNKILDKQVEYGGIGLMDSRGGISYERAIKAYYHKVAAKTYGPNSLAAKIGAPDFEVLFGAYNDRQEKLTVKDVLELADYLGIDTSSYSTLKQNKDVTGANYEKLKEALEKKAEKNPRAAILYNLIRTLQAKVTGEIKQRAEKAAFEMHEYHAETMKKAADAPKGSKKYIAFENFVAAQQAKKKAEETGRKMHHVFKILGLDQEYPPVRRAA